MATSITTVVWNILLFLFVSRKLGINTSIAVLYRKAV